MKHFITEIILQEDVLIIIKEVTVTQNSGNISPGTQHKNMNSDKYGRKTNTKSSNGNITKCSICQSLV